MTGDELHRSTPAEIQDRLRAQDDAQAHLMYRDEGGHQRIFKLGAEVRSAIVGRAETSDIPLPWDEEISRVHAIVERIGEDWAIVDDGLSRNGTFVNGERVNGRRRLRDGDRVRVGEVGLVYRAPADGDQRATRHASSGAPARISDAQRRVLVALCRPYRDGGAFAAPASNQKIADELVLSVDSIKTHMRALYESFEVEDLPQQQKRARLVELAFRSGEITQRDLDG